MRKRSFFGFLLIAFIILLLSSCGMGLNENAVKNMLNNLLLSDMEVIVDGIDADALLDEPHFEIVRFDSFDEGVFRHLAEVNFYFLKDMNVRIVRRYRYNRRHLRWERFHNVYERF